jgi:hypothetical protein
MDIDRIRLFYCFNRLFLGAPFEYQRPMSRFELWRLTSEFRDYVSNYSNKTRALEARVDNSNFICYIKCLEAKHISNYRCIFSNVRGFLKGKGKR